jgi:membrane protease subunit HflK
VLGWDRGIVPMLAMIAAGVPLYLCASSSTPVAAALIAKGLSPGAALVFLLVGPATNATTMTVIGKILGHRHLRIYIVCLILMSLAAGLLLDLVGAESVRLGALSKREISDPAALAAIKLLAVLVFGLMLVASFRRIGVRSSLREAGEQLQRVGVAARRYRWRGLLNSRYLSIMLLILLIAALPGIVLVVEPGQLGIVQRCGRVVGTDLEPGLHWHLPAPFGRGTAVDVARVRQLSIGFTGPARGEREPVADEAHYVTADENIIDIRAVVHYRVDDAVRYALGVEDPDRLIAGLAQRDLVEIASRRSIDGLYTTERRATEQQWRELLVEQVAGLDIGCRVIDARLLDVHAPATVHDSFRDVASAMEDRERSMHEASGYAATALAAASGEAVQTRASASADSLGAIRGAEGKAAAFAGVAAEHARRPRVTETRLHLETIERALASPRKYIRGTEASGAEVDLWLGFDSDAPPPAVPFWVEPDETNAEVNR